MVELPGNALSSLSIIVIINTIVVTMVMMIILQDDMAKLPVVIGSSQQPKRLRRWRDRKNTLKRIILNSVQYVQCKGAVWIIVVNYVQHNIANHDFLVEALKLLAIAI